MKNNEPHYQLDDLLYLMSKLRDPQVGCPWDLKQTPKSIINYTIEEAYELAEVVEADNIDAAAFKDELGDMLFQVVFMAQLAKDAGDFAFKDVADHLCKKMIRRHPHVFPDGKLYDEEVDAASADSGQLVREKMIAESEVKQNWEAIKQKEREEKLADDFFAGIPGNLPALLRATKLQKRAAAIGLDWENIQAVRDKLSEEINELDSALQEHEKDQHALDEVADELGDVLFTAVNLSRHLQLNAEQLLRSASNKFAARVERVNKLIQEKTESDVKALDLSAEALQAMWDAAKR